ncbi:MAG: HD domain-containing protein [Bacilli bacterium]|jgi:3'-5' exoribonuclease|nr:HD domain-containing protein [Bacilli bacterium]
MFINEFKETIKIKGTYLINQVIKGKANNGDDYLTIKLQDKTGSIDAKLWQAKPEQINTLVNGCFVNVIGNVIKYKDNLQLKIDDIEIINKDNVDVDNFVKSAPESIDSLKNELQEFIFEISDQKVNFIVSRLVSLYSKELEVYPAASNIHHAFKTGLLYHLVSMLRIAKSLSLLYKQLNVSYLYAGVILHDLGKIEELSGVVATTYTTRGRLVGHISIIHAKLMEIAHELKLEDSEQVMILEHIILSHHGKYEFGSPVLPQILEAEILTYIDNIDAKTNAITNALDNVKEGEFTSRIYALENRSFYKPKTGGNLNE